MFPGYGIRCIGSKYKEAIRRGICKINIATELKIPMADAIKECFKNNPDENDPRNYMGLPSRL